MSSALTPSSRAISGAARSATSRATSFSIKPDAPSEIRGPFSPIGTNVPGIQLCELFPQLAKITDKLAFIRSIVGATGDHYAYQCLTGKNHRETQPRGGWPSIGSVVAKLEGPVSAAVPPAVGLSPKTQHRPWGDNGQPGFLGAEYGYIYLTETDVGPTGLVRPPDVSDARQARREALLAKLREQHLKKHPGDAAVEGYAAAGVEGFRLAGPQFLSVFNLQKEPVAAVAPAS